MIRKDNWWEKIAKRGVAFMFFLAELANLVYKTVV